MLGMGCEKLLFDDCSTASLTVSTTHSRTCCPDGVQVSSSVYCLYQEIFYEVTSSYDMHPLLPLQRLVASRTN